MISQRQAQALKKRVKELEELEYRRAKYWVNDYPGMNLGNIDLSGVPRVLGRIEGARRSGHAVVVTVPNGNNTVVELFSCPLAEAPA